MSCGNTLLLGVLFLFVLLGIATLCQNYQKDELEHFRGGRRRGWGRRGRWGRRGWWGRRYPYSRGWGWGWLPWRSYNYYPYGYYNNPWWSYWPWGYY